MGKRSKEKGKKWERAIARLLRTTFPDVYRARQSRRGGAGADEGADVDGSPFWVEAKHRFTVSVWEALRQSEAKQAEKGDRRPPVVIAKIDRPPPGWRVGLPLEPPTATMKLADWVALVEDWTRLRRLAGEPVEAPVGDGDSVRC